MKEKIKTLFNESKLQISDGQAEKLFAFYNFLIEENVKYNLTAIVEFEEVVKKHFIDSAVAVNYFKGKVLDVGAGAGFPSIVLAILKPELEITMIDSLNKRVNFLSEVCKRLEIKNAKAIHVRAEDFKAKESFDVITARAVAQLRTLSEYLLPFAKVGGKVVCYKGGDVFEEVENAQSAIKILGGQVEEITKFSIFDNLRTIVLMRKISHTPPGYPRGGNLPRKKPL